ncbi:MAG: hydantoinase B/oxoprolinase family protein [Porticoccaceae bacterium]|nr:hydantoinase B/oxoprolinase family protein [Porticoccaceae bacterium]
MAVDSNQAQFQQSADISGTINAGSISENEGFDPITAEVIRSSFDNIAREMSVVLLRTSGSAVLTESKDFSTILFDANCNQVGVVGYLLYHLATSRLGVRALAKQRCPDDVKPGDAFMCNDPHGMGAAHQGDVGIIMPVFHDLDGEEKLVGWCFANAHMSDVGGSAISGFAPNARDVYSEALRFPGTRVARNGILDEEWVGFISNNVRVPLSLISDTRSLMAACNSGARRYREMIDEYGYDRLKAYSDYNISLTEKAFAERIEQLPEGTYRTYEWVEYDGTGTPELYPMYCEMTVRDRKLHFAFSGCPQVPAFVNAAQGGLEGNVIAPIVCQLAPDVPLNEGFWRRIEIDHGEPGTITNPVVPAPVTMAHAAGGVRVGRMVQEAIVAACSLSESEAVRGRVSGLASGALAPSVWYGENKNGDPSVFLPLDSGVGVGGGAQSIGDGQDNYGLQATLSLNWADVEVYELSDPVLLLWRRIKTNSGGAGRYRGGMGMDAAFMLRDGISFVGQTFLTATEIPGKGFAGGYPGSLCTSWVLRDTNVREVISAGGLPKNKAMLVGENDPTLRANTTNIHLDGNDVFHAVASGGGGLGDPFLRPPGEIADDLNDGLVSPVAAEKLYGAVVLGDGTELYSLDEAATWARRDGIRLALVPGKQGSLADIPSNSGTEGVRHSGKHMVCSHCQTALCDDTQDWKHSVSPLRHSLADFFEQAETIVRRRAQDPVDLIEYYCPNCACCLAVDVAVVGQDREPPNFHLSH